MKIQSFNVSVPAPCLNRCKFCVSNTRKNEKDVLKIQNSPLSSIEVHNNIYSDTNFNSNIAYYKDRFEYVSERCDTLLITSTGEPLMNKKFIEFIGIINNIIRNPFTNIEIQTSGLLLDEKYIDFLIEKVRVKTISLSLSALDINKNYEYNNPTHEKYRLDIQKICKLIKSKNLNLRLSLTLTDYYDKYNSLSRIPILFERIKNLGADQVTFKTLYESGGELPEDKWVREHRAIDSVEKHITEYIRKEGKIIRKLITGEYIFSIEGMSVVLNKDCMSTRIIDNVLRYIILKADGKLYTLWDDPASLLF